MHAKWFIKILLFFFLITPLLGIGQRITYTEPERDDSRGMAFEIIGKINGNFLVYKNIRATHFICVYDDDMKLVAKNNLTFLPDKVLNVDFIAYPDFCYMIYQYQRRSILKCMAVKFDSKGQQVGDAKLLDTTFIGFFADNKIYNTINSEDKQKIIVYKIQKKYEKYTYTTVLLNSNLELIKKSRILMQYEERKNTLSDFYADNEGNFIFAIGGKSTNRDFINSLSLITKDAFSDTFNFHNINIGKGYLDEIKVKVDNINKRYLINSFYYSTKRGDIDGIYTGLWDRNTNSQIIGVVGNFNDTLKREARNQGSYKMAFNNFFIKDVILKKDGGFLLTGEDYYTQSRSNPWNRYDYLYGSPFNNYDYYYSPGYYNPYRYRNLYNANQTRYYYDNIVVLSINKKGETEWANIIHKSQFDDESDRFMSFHLFNAGKIHFLFNESERKNRVLNDDTIDADGVITRNPTLKSLDKGYDFMPMYGKQVGARQVIIPCDYRNFICFAKIDY